MLVSLLGFGFVYFTLLRVWWLVFIVFYFDALLISVLFVCVIWLFARGCWLGVSCWFCVIVFIWLALGFGCLVVGLLLRLLACCGCWFSVGLGVVVVLIGLDLLCLRWCCLIDFVCFSLVAHRAVLWWD